MVGFTFISNKLLTSNKYYMYLTDLKIFLCLPCIHGHAMPSIKHHT